MAQRLKFVQVQNRSLPISTSSDDAAITAVAFAPTDQSLPPYFLASSNTGTVASYNFRANDDGTLSFMKSSLVTLENAVNDVAISGDGLWFALAMENHAIKLYDSSTMREIWKMQTSLDGAMTACCIPVQSNIIIAGTSMGTIFVYDARMSRKIVRRLAPAHTNIVNGVSAHPDGSVFLTTGVDGIARVWDTTGPLLATIVGSEHRGLGSGEFSPNGRYALLGSLGDGSLGLWDLAHSGRLKCVRKYFRKNSKYSLKATFMDDGSAIVGGSEDGKLLAWDLSNTRVLAEYETSKPNHISVPLACAASKGLVAYGGIGNVSPFVARLVPKRPNDEFDSRN